VSIKHQTFFVYEELLSRDVLQQSQNIPKTIPHCKTIIMFIANHKLAI